MQVDQFGDIEVTKQQIRELILAEAYNNGDVQSQECALADCDLELRLAHGGIVDRNAALMDGDIVYVQFKSEEPELPVSSIVCKKWKNKP